MLHTWLYEQCIIATTLFMEIVVDIMSSIEEMFARLSRQVRFKPTSTFMNLHQKKGQLVCEHMMKVIAYFNELENLGAQINAETKNYMVLNTLSDTLALFKINYELNKKNCTLAALMKDLQITKNILKKKNSISLEANRAEGPSSFKPNTKAKGKNNNKKKGSGSTTPKKEKF